MRKLFTLFAAMTLCVGLWAETPAVGDTIIDANSGVYFAVTAVGETNTVKVIRNTAYSGNIIIPASVTSDMVTFTVNEIAATAFGNCKSLYSIDIPASVASIGDNGFRTCSGLANIAVHWTESGKIPSIGSTVFQGIASGAKLHIPAGTKAIYNAASQWKTLSITEDQMPAVGEQFEDAASGLKFEICAMGVKLIANTYQATSYTIPTQVTYKSITYGVAVFASDAFQGCSQLADITVSWTDAAQLPKNMTEALSVIGCATGTKLHVPTGKIEIYEAVEGLKEVVTIVEDYEVGDMFRDAASGLRFKVIALGTPDTVAVTDDMYSETSYTVPVSVTRGGHTFVVSEIRSFGVSSTLTALYFAEGSQVTKIGLGAFNGCSALTSLTIPACVIDITGAFNSNTALQSITFAEGSQLTTIEESAFNGCSALQSVNFPASVTTIGNRAFENCSALQSVTFAEGSQLTTIGSRAFHSSGLTSIDLPAGVTGITEAFYKCYHLTTVNFAKDAQIKEIGYEAFYYDTALTTITIPEGVTSIGGYAFDSCVALPSITIPEGVTSIGEYAFKDCSALPSIDIPASVTTIEACAFADCSNAQSITFAEGTQLQTIGYSAFAGCKSLPSITIPASVTKLGASALVECPQLTSVTFEEGIQLTEIEKNVFADDSALTSITIPASVTKLGIIVFGRCVQLASVTFEEGSKLTSIEYGCFKWCPSLTSIDIPLTVAEIDYETFLDCSALADVTVHWTDAAQLPTLGYDVFKGIAAGAKLHVPAGTTAIYEAAEQWKDFTIVEESDPDPKVVRDTLDAVSACGSYVWEIYGKQLTLTESGVYNDTTIIEDSVITTLPLTIEPTTKTNYPAVQKYGSRLLVVDANAIHAEGWPFAEADVNWYKVAEPEDQLVKSGSYYYTADERFDGTYYALITISKEYDGCTEQLRTVDLVCPTAANQIVSMAPTMVTPRQTITLSHLDATSVNSVRVYSAQGQLLDAFSVEQSEFDFHAAEGSGCYLVIVENGKQQETFKYIVK